MWRNALIVLVVATLAAGAANAATYGFRIEPVYNQLQGREVEVDITCYTYPQQRVLNLWLSVAYDLEALSFAGAVPLDSSLGCKWDMSYNTFGPVVDGPDGKRYGVASVAYAGAGPYGSAQQSCPFENGETAPFTIARLKFLVSNDRGYECDTLPLRFVWFDCVSNALVDTGFNFHLSSALIDPLTQTDIHAPTLFPSFLGAPDSCEIQFDPDYVRDIEFTNGYVQVICPDTIDYRGDINCNGLSNEIADFIYFAKYFIEGPSAFANTAQCSFQTSDLNCDGLGAQLEDLVRQLNIVTGYWQPDPCGGEGQLFGLSSYVDGILAAESVSVSAAHIVADGNVTPVSLIADSAFVLAYQYHADGDTTAILILPNLAAVALGQPLPTFTGPFLDLGDAEVRHTVLVNPDARRIGSELYPRGDLNCNGMGWEFADMIQLEYYLLMGDTSLTWQPKCGLRGADVNCDGRKGGVDDLVALLGTFRGVFSEEDCPPILPPLAGSFTYENDTLSIDGPAVTCVRVVVSGEIIPQLLLTDSMVTLEYYYHSVGDSTVVLMFLRFQGSAPSEPLSGYTGPVLDLGGAEIQTLELVSPDGRRIEAMPTGANNGDDNTLPSTYALDQNYPNPFNPSTQISFSLPSAGAVKLTVHNVMGEVVRTLIDRRMNAGRYTMEWNGKNDSHQSVASGIYFYRIYAGDFTSTRKMMLVK